MEQEIEILREKYEELRYKESDRIRTKYMKMLNN
jgi:5-enolpyruvylshikimate-3-phosphate synthase